MQFDRRVWCVGMLFGLLVLGSAGCATDSAEVPSPLSVAMGRGRPDGLEVTALELQSRVMDFSDLFAAQVSRAYRDLADSVADPRVRREMLVLRHAAVWAAYEVAAEPNPEVAFLDMVALASLQRIVAEDWVLPDLLGDSPEGKAALQTFAQMEDEIWRQAGDLLTEEESEALRGLIMEWRERNPGPQLPSVARFDEFAYARLQSPTATAQGRALFLGTMNEVVRAVNETRIFGERMAFLMTRVPLVVSMQVQLMTTDLALSPEYGRLLEDAHAVSAMLEQLPATLEQQRNDLVAQIGAERKAAINQVADRVAQEREELLRQVEESQGQLRTTLEALKGTIEAAGQLVASTDALVASADGLVARVKPPEGAARGEPSRPIDLADVQATLQDATHLLEAAHQLLSSEAVDVRAGQLEAAITRLNKAARSSADYAFRRAVALVAIAVAAGVAGALLLRLVPRRARV